MRKTSLICIFVSQLQFIKELVKILSKNLESYETTKFKYEKD